MNVAFLGGGNMASAMIGGLLAKGWQASQVIAVDIDDTARARLEREFGVSTTADAVQAVSRAECVLFAVKPQQMRAVAGQVAAGIAGKLVISIAAGIRTEDLARWLGGHGRIVRAMPNTPALLRAGISAAFATADVSAADRSFADDLLGAIGKVLWVDAEAQLDGVTAVSGSGPAYVFYLIEAMEAAATDLGFTPEAARLLATETALGAAKLAAASPDPASTLRARVTSKGGTTERAVSILDARDVKAHVREAIRGAAERSRELGDQFGRD